MAAPKTEPKAKKKVIKRSGNFVKVMHKGKKIRRKVQRVWDRNPRRFGSISYITIDGKNYGLR